MRCPVAGVVVVVLVVLLSPVLLDVRWRCRCFWEWRVTVVALSTGSSLAGISWQSSHVVSCASGLTRGGGTDAAAAWRLLLLLLLPLLFTPLLLSSSLCVALVVEGRASGEAERAVGNAHVPDVADMPTNIFARARRRIRIRGRCA